MRADARIQEPRTGAVGTLAGLEANARLARTTGMVVHMVVSREPGVVDYARFVAATSGVGVTVDLRPATVRVRFDPTAP
jgi:hypothetical protein